MIRIRQGRRWKIRIRYRFKLGLEQGIKEGYGLDKEYKGLGL